jgi:hypothetical protein
VRIPVKTFAALCLALAALISAPALLAQGSGSGTTAADFLIFPPASRADAMGGVLDGMGNYIEGIHLNPAVLAPITDFRLQLNVNPLPNEVTDSQLSAGFPLFGGTAAAAVQLLNTGGFTFVNGAGQAEATVSVFDAAAVLGYSHYIWRTIAMGLSAKGIYSTLGDYQAFAFAADAGVAAWFETPHIGQRPKPPTYKQLEAEFQKEKKGIDGEKSKRTAEATKKSAAVQKAVEAQEKVLAGLSAQLDKAEEAKRPPLEAKKSEAEAALEQRRAELQSAQAEEQGAMAEIESWYQEALAAAQARFDKKVADLDWIQQERQRLYAVIDDPTQELTEEMVNANIDSSIAKTRELLGERTAAIQARKEAYDQRRGARIEEIRQVITGYEGKIEEEVGPRRGELNKEIESLKSQKAELESGDPKLNKPQIQALDKQIAAKQKEAEALLADPWLKRLQDRITAKNQEIKQIEADMAAMAQATEQAAKEASARADKATKGFEKLRVELNKELKKAKLKRELDLLSASRQAGKDKAQRSYKEKEKRLYLQLLEAMYGNEEKIFQTRLSAASDDAALRRLDFDTERQKAREVLDDDWAFEQRLLAAKLRESPNDPSLKQELAQKETAYKQALADLDKKAAEFNAAEAKALADTMAAVKEERRKMRLVYLQTDKPYLNTSANLVVRNVGTPMKFIAEGYPLPSTFSAALSYALLNVPNHNLKLASQINVPFYDQLSVGLGLEYVFANLGYLRAGYAFGIQDPDSLDRSFSAGFGVRLALGFTECAVDYAFRPLPDYGLQHSIGVAISF